MHAKRPRQRDHRRTTKLRVESLERRELLTTASITPSAQITNEGDPVTFIGSVIDHPNTELDYRWDFGDGASTAGTLTPQHTFTDNGNYAVRFAASDTIDALAEEAAAALMIPPPSVVLVATEASVTANNLPPIADASGPYAGDSGAPISFTAQATDPSATDMAAGFTYSWDFGDGSASVSGANPSYSYTSAGSYDVTLSVTDKDGGIGTATTTAAITPVNDEQVVTTNNTMPVNQGATATISSAFLVTSDTDNTAAELIYTITSGTSNGSVLLSGSATASFTQADIDADLVTYQHSGTETTSDRFDFTVDDGQGAASNGTFMISVLQTMTTTLNFATYFGGSSSGGELTRGITQDDAGNIYVTGGFESTNMPITYDLKQSGTTSSGVKDYDIIVAKFDPNGSHLWTTRLGGPNYDRAYEIRVDQQGFIYVAGRGGPGNTPTINPTGSVYGSTSDHGIYGIQAGFIAKLRPTGNSIEWSMILQPENGTNMIRDIDLDDAGNLYVLNRVKGGSYANVLGNGLTNTDPANGASESVETPLVTKHTPSGALEWATHVGGTGLDWSTGSLVVDGSGDHLYVAFPTFSTDILTTPDLLTQNMINQGLTSVPAGFPSSYQGQGDIFLARLDSVNGDIYWGSYIGGPNIEDAETHNLAMGPQGNAYLAIPTGGITQPMYQYGPAGASGTFAVKVDESGQLVSNAMVSSSTWQMTEGTGVDQYGNMTFTGFTRSVDFPATDGSSLKGNRDSIVVTLSDDFSELLYATFFGSDNNGDTANDFERSRGLSVSKDGTSIVIVGNTTNSDWPVTNGAYQTSMAGPTDTFLFKMDRTIPNSSLNLARYQFENENPGLPVASFTFAASDDSANIVNNGRTILSRERAEVRDGSQAVVEEYVIERVVESFSSGSYVVYEITNMTTDPNHQFGYIWDPAQGFVFVYDVLNGSLVCVDLSVCG